MRKKEEFGLGRIDVGSSLSSSFQASCVKRSVSTAGRSATQEGSSLATDTPTALHLVSSSSTTAEYAGIMSFDPTAASVV